MIPSPRKSTLGILKTCWPILPIVGVAMLAAVSTFVPSTEQDTMVYHFPLARWYAEQGGYAPRFDTAHQAFPLAWHALYTMCWQVSGQTLSAIQNTVIWTLGGIIVWHLVRHYSKHSATPFLAVLFALSAETTIFGPSDGKNDFPAAVFAFCAAYMAALGCSKHEWKLLLVAGVVAGIATAIKVTAGVALGAAAPLLLWLFPREIPALSRIRMLIIPATLVIAIPLVWIVGVEWMSDTPPNTLATDLPPWITRPSWSGAVEILNACLTRVPVVPLLFGVAVVGWKNISRGLKLGCCAVALATFTLIAVNTLEPVAVIGRYLVVVHIGASVLLCMILEQWRKWYAVCAIVAALAFIAIGQRSGPEFRTIELVLFAGGAGACFVFLLWRKVRISSLHIFLIAAVGVASVFAGLSAGRSVRKIEALFSDNGRVEWLKHHWLPYEAVATYNSRRTPHDSMLLGIAPKLYVDGPAYSGGKIFNGVDWRMIPDAATLVRYMKDNEFSHVLFSNSFGQIPGGEHLYSDGKPPTESFARVGLVLGVVTYASNGDWTAIYELRP